MTKPKNKKRTQPQDDAAKASARISMAVKTVVSVVKLKTTAQGAKTASLAGTKSETAQYPPKAKRAKTKPADMAQVKKLRELSHPPKQSSTVQAPKDVVSETGATKALRRNPVRKARIKAEEAEKEAQRNAEVDASNKAEEEGQQEVEENAANKAEREAHQNTDKDAAKKAEKKSKRAQKRAEQKAAAAESPAKSIASSPIATEAIPAKLPVPSQAAPMTAPALSHLSYRLYGAGGSTPDGKGALEWLASISSSSDSPASPTMALSLSLRTNGHPEAVLLLCNERLAIFRLAERRGMTPRKPDQSVIRALEHLFSAGAEERRVRFVAFRAAATALRISGATGLHCSLTDLSGIRLHTGAVLSPNLTFAIRSLTPHSFQRDYGTVKPPHQTLPLDAGFLATAQDAITAFLHTYHPPVAAALHANTAPRVDTRLLPARDLILGAAMLQAQQAVWALEPKARCVAFAKVTAKQGNLKGAKLAVECERFREQPRARQGKQIVRFTTAHGDTFTGRTQATKGKTSKVKVKGAGMPSLEEITCVEVLGRGDLSLATELAGDFWRDVLLCVDPQNISAPDSRQQYAAMRRLDASALFYPLFHGHPANSLPTKWGVIKRCWEQCGLGRYDVIERGRLDPSQKAAARAIAAPLEDGADATSRIVMIQGPPGTGKTTVIGEFAKQWLAWSRSWTAAEEKTAGTLASVWCVCKSNAATKNIASSLRRSGVPFVLLVSSNFYQEWHEHMYGEVEDELVLTSSLKVRLAVDGRGDKSFLRGIRVLLCTVDSLSSPTLVETGLFQLRPMHCLLVDEASQLELGSYPHLLRAHCATLGRIVFFGDDEQLAPYGADSFAAAAAIPSVFELPHLRAKAHTLTRSYRLPQAICAFISQSVYAGVLSPGPGVHSAPLEQCVRFIDVSSGRESPVGTSYTNVREAQLLCVLVRDLFPPSSDFRILTTYAAQRDLLEDSLRRANLPWEGRVFTADAFQGQEADVVLVSLVRDGLPQKGHGVGFVARQRRTNVMLTRAKAAMYVFSSRRFLVAGGAKAKDTLVGRLAKQVGERGWCREEDVFNGRCRLGHQVVAA